MHLEEETDHKEPLVSNPLGFGMLSGLVSGGIDVLETIGKKTFETVTVKDEVGILGSFETKSFRKLDEEG